jgi:hypothetical protein
MAAFGVLVPIINFQEANMVDPHDKTVYTDPAGRPVDPSRPLPGEPVTTHHTRETVVSNTSGGGGSGWFIAGILVIAIGIVAYIFFGGSTPEPGVVNEPAITAPAAPEATTPPAATAPADPAPAAEPAPAAPAAPAPAQ